METTIVLDSVTSFLDLPQILWVSLSSSFGTIPAAILTILMVIGLTWVLKTCLTWSWNKLKSFFSKKNEVTVPLPQGRA